MDSSNASLAIGPAESRLIRILFYIGDGTMIGATLYFMITTALFLIFDFSISELWSMGLIVIILVAVRWWAVIFAKRSSPSPVTREWRKTRRWMGISAVAIFMTTVLFVVQFLTEGFSPTWSIIDATPIAIYALLLGFVIRMFGHDLSASKND